MRRACLEAVFLLRRHSRDLDALQNLHKRGFSSLPEDISNAARQAKFPTRRHIGQPSPGAAAEAAAGTTQAAKSVPLDTAQEGAKVGT